MKVHVNFRNLHSNTHFLLYIHEVYAKTKNLRNILPVTLATAKTMFLVYPVSPLQLAPVNRG